MMISVSKTFSNIFSVISRHYIIIMIIFLPLVMFHWMLPFITEIAPGRDFLNCVAIIQSEYLCALKTGTLPSLIVWNDVQNNQWAGVAGVFLPLPYLAAMLPGYFAGNAIQWNIFLKLLAIPIVHLALFKFLTKLRTATQIAFILSTITVYSPRILFSFFLGPEIEAWSGHLLLCAAIGFFFLEPSGLKNPLLIIGATYWLVCSGYPESIYFCLLGAGIFAMLMPFMSALMLPDRPAHGKKIFRFWADTALYVIIGLMLSAAFLLPFLLDNLSHIQLVQQDYAAACVNTDTVSGLVHNFFSPIRSDFVGGLFGGSPLLLAAVLLPVMPVFRISIPKTIWLILGLIIIICLCMLGDNTPVHYYLWKTIPFYSATRFPARISIMLPVLFLLLLTWLFGKPSSLAPETNTKLPPISILAGFALLATIFYMFCIFTKAKINLSFFPRTNLEIIPQWAEPVYIFMGILIMIAMAIYGLKVNQRIKSISAVVLCIGTCFQLVVLFRYAPVPRQKMAYTDTITYEEYRSQKRISMDTCNNMLYPGDAPTFPAPVLYQMEQYFIEPDLGKIYRKHIDADCLDQAHKFLNSTRKQEEVVVENYNGGFVRDEVDNATDRVSLVYSSYNRMVFEAQACQPSFFVFAYNFSGHWRVWVNGEISRSYRANGHAHAVPVPAGESTIEFRYWSWAAFWGMLISCVTLSAIGFVCGLFGVRKPTGYFIAFVVLIIAGNIFFLWYHGLYSGENLHTNYTWQSIYPDAPRNIAFGKPTQMAIKPKSEFNLDLIHNSRHGVDGGQAFSSCFVTDYQFFPWWEVDLLRPESIGSVIIYASLQGKETNKIIFHTLDRLKISTDYDFFVIEEQPLNFNQLPLTVAVSIDGRKWEPARITELHKDKPLIIKPEKPITARYIRIIAFGVCRLCLNEVEVYPPSPEQMITNNRNDE